MKHGIEPVLKLALVVFERNEGGFCKSMMAMRLSHAIVPTPTSAMVQMSVEELMAPKATVPMKIALQADMSTGFLM